ncbi:MAG: membrane protein insertase YidC [Alphaproteobacteria bacterium]|nr:membrane protein insertase YidC [Alphaproteobacteria bacterium]
MSFNNNNNDPKSTKNFVIAMCVFMALMFGVDYFTKQSSVQQASDSGQVIQSADVGTQQDIQDAEEKEITVSDALSKNSRIKFENNHIQGSIDLNGGIIDNLTLKDYKETIESNSGNVALMIPRNTANQTYFGVSYSDKSNNEEIAEKAVWVSESDSNTLQSIQLKTQTQNGLVIERLITFDDHYMITVRDRVHNVSSKDIVLSPSAYINRYNPKNNNYAVVHEGLVGNISGKTEEIKYADVEDHSSYRDTQWLGYTDIYWLTAIINKDKNTLVNYSKPTDDSYRISTKRKNDINVKPESMVELSYKIFAGPKDIKVLRDYQASLNLDNFEMAIDFGWFFMITKPLIILMDIFAKIFSNMGFVILLLTLLFKVITYPLTKKSVMSAAKMKEVQPKIAQIQKMYAYDKMRLNQELIALYKKEQISPMSGCLPMLLQAPIFFCLYKVFFISIEMRHAPLFGWIKDLSAPDGLYLFNLFGLIDWTPPSFLQIGLWPLIMGATMFLQQKMTSASKNKSIEKTKEQKMQENMMLVLPLMFTYICASFPVGVVVYWTISNIFGIIQQQMANKKLSVK